MTLLQRSSVLTLIGLAMLPSAHAAQKWLRISSAHFSVLTDGGESKGALVALRFEQMRSVFAQLLMKNKLSISEPLDIVAFETDAEYFSATPLRNGQPVSNVGFLLPGEDRIYIVLNLAAPESWRAVQYELAGFLLRYNYPPAPDWFDQGLAAYYSSLDLGEKESKIGGDPQSFTEILKAQSWMPPPSLFGMHARPGADPSRPPRDLFHAQAWLLMHYLISENKLSEAGACVGYMELQKTPAAEAIQKAFGMSSAELEQKLKEHLQTLSGDGIAFSPPLGRLDVGSSRKDVPDAQAHALIAELQLRIPEWRQQAKQKLEALAAVPETDTAIVHRALGWLALEESSRDPSSGYPRAREEFASAIGLDSRDAWSHYYLALMKYRAAQSGNGEFQGLPNMMQDLQIVADWNDTFAEAYNMLAMARLQGGGTHSAMETIKAAIQLSPRNQDYLLNLARIQMAAKQWDAAAALLGRLSSSSELKIASAAREYLEDLPTLKKYGLMPVHPGGMKSAAPTQVIGQKPDSDDEQEHAEAPPAPAAPDRRKTQYLKGKLLSVDCSAPPAATLTVLVRGKRIKLLTPDSSSLVLIGAGAFSCDWKDLPVIANYKAGGKADGDLVSLEVQ
ncbi:MAG TPA: tetratricopeptide repeat protein [Terriglobales bacterium]